MSKTHATIVIRLPPETHAKLKELARQRETSMNLLVASLLAAATAHVRLPVGTAGRRCAQCEGRGWWLDVSAGSARGETASLRRQCEQCGGLGRVC